MPVHRQGRRTLQQIALFHVPAHFGLAILVQRIDQALLAPRHDTQRAHDLLRAGHALGNAHLGHRAVTLAVLDDAADHQQRNEQQQDQPAHGEETQQQFQ